MQRRRWLPTFGTQGFQRLAQRFGLERMLHNAPGQPAMPATNPLAKNRLFQKLLGRISGVGIRPEPVAF